MQFSALHVEGGTFGMAILRKGSRKIDVAGYRLFLAYSSEGHVFASQRLVAHDHCGGVSIRSWREAHLTARHRPARRVATSVSRLRNPADVAHLVLQALSDGWQPDVDGNSVVRKVTLGQSDALAVSGRVI